MTALSGDYGRRSRGVGYIVEVPLAASEVVYEGSLVAVNTSASGYAYDGTDAANRLTVGVAIEAATGGATDGAVSVKVRFGCEFLFAASSVTQAMLGTPMYMVDDNTVDDAAGATNDVFVGIMTEYVSAALCWVFVPGPVAYPTSGVTASVAELNILDGCTATYAELNILDGATVTYGELNLLDASAALGAVIGRAQVTVTAAQLKALAATNIELVAAPGAGLAIIPVGVMLFMDHGGTDFVQTAGTDHLAVRYSASTEISELGSEAQCTALVEASADARLWADVGASVVPVANTAIDLDNNGANEFTTGDGDLKVTVYYRVVPMA